MDLTMERSDAPDQPPAIATQPRTVAILRPRISPPYGYHNSFHTHATEASPPTYSLAKTESPPTTYDNLDVPLPSYSCSISRDAIVDMRCEFLDPFLQSSDVRWRTQYVVLHGTKLATHTIKSISSRGQIKLRRQTHNFSLQHAEVGLAVDMPPEEPLAKFPLFDILPTNVRRKMHVTKPHLFEPKRDWILRLRLEGCQFLMAFVTEGVMLDWVEDLCAAIDIAQPLDDRSYPRYRSLPRRSRRQRQLENAFREDYEVIGMESLGQRLVQQQERIISTLYPNLANDNGNGGGNRLSQNQNNNELEQVTSQDPDMDDLDPADIRDSPYLITDALDNDDGSRTNNSRANQQISNLENRTSKHFTSISPNATATLRYRRRCAPIMNKYSPRSSDIIFCRGKRMRIDQKRERLLQFDLAPPRYPKTTKTDKAVNRRSVMVEPFGEPFLTARSWRNPETTSPQRSSSDEGEEEIRPCRTTSRGSGQISEGDAASVQSVAGMTIGSANETSEPVSITSTHLDELRRSDSEVMAVETAEAIITPLKEKVVGRTRRGVSRTREEQEAHHAFASLVL